MPWTVFLSLNIAARIWKRKLSDNVLLFSFVYGVHFFFFQFLEHFTLCKLFGTLVTSKTCCQKLFSNLNYRFSVEGKTFAIAFPSQNDFPSLLLKSESTKRPFIFFCISSSVSLLVVACCQQIPTKISFVYARVKHVMMLYCLYIFSLLR